MKITLNGHEYDIKSFTHVDIYKFRIECSLAVIAQIIYNFDETTELIVDGITMLLTGCEMSVEDRKAVVVTCSVLTYHLLTASEE